MELRQFGNTSLSVSRIGLGLAALGRPGYINLGHGQDIHNHQLPAMRTTAMDMLDLAYSKGIRYYDVARSYGKAEEFLGSWMKLHPEKKDIVTGSKWGYVYTADWKVTAEKHEIKNHSESLLQTQWKETMDTLGAPPDIYHIHSATLDSKVLENNKVLGFLWELKNQGILLGLSLSGTQQKDTLQQALEIRREHTCLFQSIQVTWNILEQSCTPLLHQAKEMGCGIIVKEALANGRLTDRNTEDTFTPKKEVLQILARQHQTTLDGIALAYVLAQPWASIVLSGACTAEQLASNLQAERIALSEEDLDLCKKMAESPEAYWKKRSALPWN